MRLDLAKQLKRKTTFIKQKDQFTSLNIILNLTTMKNIRISLQTTKLVLVDKILTMMLFNNPTGAAEAGVTRRGESPPTSITRAGETTEARRRVVGDDVMMPMTSQRMFDVLMMNFFYVEVFFN